MKTTIRVLSLVLCLAMLIGVFAASAMAASRVVVLEEDLNTAPGKEVGNWTKDFHTDAFTWEPYVAAEENAENQHIKLVHEAEEGKRILIGYRLPDDALTYVYPRNEIGALDISFQAKMTGCTYLRIDSQLRASALNSDLTTVDTYARSLPAVDIKDGDVYVGDTKVGTIPASIDLTKWCDYTLRISRQSGTGGQFDLQLIINGIVVGEKDVASTNNSNAQNRFAIHARNAGSVEIDNIKVQELYLVGDKGAVKEGSVNTLFESGFGAQGTELNFRDAEAGEEQFTVGKWADGAEEGTSYEFVKDEETSASGGYLIVKHPNSDNIRYANLNLKKEIPAGETFWFGAKIKLDDAEVSLHTSYRIPDGQGRRVMVSIRPDGIYYKADDSGFKKACSLSGVDVTKWNTYIIKVDGSITAKDAATATVYVNGVEKGQLKPYFASDEKVLKIASMKVNGLTGTAYVDNVVVTYGAPPAMTGDASIIAIAAMMIPVSGIGLGALCIKRKKEN